MSGRRPLRLLSIAGSDPSGGAGIQADLKTFAAHDTYGMAVVTAITAQGTTGVGSVEPVGPAAVERQLRAVLDDIGVDAIKIGMLATAGVVAVVARCLEQLEPRVPVVLDPVLAASDGTALLAPGGLQRLREELLPLATVITPNRAEAGALLGREVRDADQAVAAALALAALGPAALVTGGDAGGDQVCDVLAEGDEARVLCAPRLLTVSSHGTGCTLSSAVAVGLASGRSLGAAVESAIAFVRRAMDPGLELGRGRAPLDHAGAAEPAPRRPAGRPR